MDVAVTDLLLEVVPLASFDKLSIVPDDDKVHDIVEEMESVAADTSSLLVSSFVGDCVPLDDDADDVVSVAASVGEVLPVAPLRVSSELHDGEIEWLLEGVRVALVVSEVAVDNEEEDVADHETESDIVFVSLVSDSAKDRVGMVEETVMVELLVTVLLLAV